MMQSSLLQAKAISEEKAERVPDCLCPLERARHGSHRVCPCGALVHPDKRIGFAILHT